jgi:hypothetical protein
MSGGCNDGERENTKRPKKSYYSDVLYLLRSKPLAVPASSA